MFVLSQRRLILPGIQSELALVWSNSLVGGVREACVMLHSCSGVFSWITSKCDLVTKIEGEATQDKSHIVPEKEVEQSGWSK
jgi:hypothetical protein